MTLTIILAVILTGLIYVLADLALFEHRGGMERVRRDAVKRMQEPSNVRVLPSQRDAS